MASPQPGVIAGVDTHAETHHAALITTTGQHLADQEFPATPTGYAQLVAFLTSQGPLIQAGVEGTSSYGAGLARVLQAEGIDVVEVIRPTRTQRRRGKSDPIDAYAAASATLTGEYLPVPKQAGGDVDAIRAILTARRSAVKARTAAMNQIKNLLITAPIDLRQRFRPLSDATLITTLAGTRPQPATTDTTNAVLIALRRLARRHHALTTEITQADTELDALTNRANPALRAAYGIGPATAAQLLVTAGQNTDRLTSEAAFAALCGASPIPASSGKTHRHRLNRGGDRQANTALHHIAMVRLSKDPRTKAYAQRRRGEDNTITSKGILRCLKRAIAREVYRHLTRPRPVPTTTDLRPLRLTKNITLSTAATHLQQWPSELSRLERGLKHNDQLASTYRDWLNAQPSLLTT